MKLLVPIFSLLFILVVVEASAPIDKCDHCVTVLRCVYGHFGKNVKSKRLLANRLESTCKRYPHYKQSCLKVMKANFLKIFGDLQPEKYDPLQTCIDIKECVQPTELLSNFTKTAF